MCTPAGATAPARTTPTFTQHGFRYAEVTGLGAPLMPDQIRAVEMHTALSQHSAVEFGTPLLNKIQHAELRGQKSNVMSVPTDCPQRDERRGWTGDAALTAEEALYNYGMGAVYSKWLDVFADDQAPNGGSNDFVPALGGGEGAPNWQSAFPTLIWGLLTYYGDGTMATKHFDALGKYYDNLGPSTPDGAKGFRRAMATGWSRRRTCGRQAPDRHVRAAPRPADGRGDLRRRAVARRGGGAARAPRVAARAPPPTFTPSLTPPRGTMAAGYRSSRCRSISCRRRSSRKSSITSHDIEVTNGGHTTRASSAYRARSRCSARRAHRRGSAHARRTDYPSYGFMITHLDEPATTIWELWDSPTEGPGMNSRNHIMFGTVGSWFYKGSSA